MPRQCPGEPTSRRGWPLKWRVIIAFMSIVYSTSEAKAKFSEVLSLVRSGKTIQVAYHGEPVAEIRPIEERKLSNDERLEKLRIRGVYLPAKSPLFPFKAVIHRPGALQRFLDDRNP